MPVKQALTTAADRLLDVLIVPGYTRIGPALRRNWWPADPTPFPDQPEVVVTGGASGLGAATAAGLAVLGARVHLVGRNAGRLAAAADLIRQRQPSAQLVCHESDVSDLDAVRTLAQSLSGELPALHALIHCAGLVPPRRQLTAQGHELAFATHVLGPYLLTMGLRELLGRAGDGRVIWVSSGGMYSAALSTDLESEHGRYQGVRAYARTKRMQVVLAEQLGTAFTRSGDPVVHSMHPGWAATPGISDSLPAFEKLTKPLLRTAEQGADTIVWLARAPEPARTTGKFWHDRRVRPTHYLPWQHDDPAARAQLWETCQAVG